MNNPIKINRKNSYNYIIIEMRIQIIQSNSEIIK